MWIRRFWGVFVGAVFGALVWAFTDLLGLNVDEYATSEHLNTLGPQILRKLAMFSHTWLGGAVFGGFVSTTILFVLYSVAQLYNEWSKSNNPFKISFDAKNPHHLHKEDIVWFNGEKYENETYRIEIQNITSRTIVGVSCAFEGHGGLRKFVMSDKTTCELHPDAREYVEIIRLNVANPGEFADDERVQDYTISVTGVDVKACRKTIHIDADKNPILSLHKA